MSLGVIQFGPYGKYYSYTYKGEKKNLSLKQQGEVLTPEQLDELIENKKLTFDVNGEPITAEIVEYYHPYKKRNMEKIVYSGKLTKTPTTPIDSGKDKSVLEGLKDEILFLFEDNNEFYANKKSTSLINSKGLSQHYTCTSIGTDITSVLQVIIYSGKDYSEKENQILTFYLLTESRSGYKSKKKLLTEKEYSDLLDDKKAKADALEKRDKEYEEIVKKAQSWLNDLKDKVMDGSGVLLPTETLLPALEPIVKDVSPSDMHSLITHPPVNISNIFADKSYVTCMISRYSENYEQSFEKMKAFTLRKFRDYYDYKKLKSIRDEIYNDIMKNGLESVVDEINIDSALDLGYFNNLKTLLKSTKYDYQLKVLCYNSFLEVTDGDELKTKLLNLLKVYHDFYNFPEKDIKSLAKFIAKNNLKDYYDKICEYDSAIEVLFEDGSSELKKKILVGVAGGGRDLSFLNRDKSFYFEKTTKVKDNVIVRDPVWLLEELRKLIKFYNSSSDVAILTNIILEPDGEHFTYQFYTFSDSEKGETFDGRRLQYMTRLFNKTHKEKIYFDYDDSEEG